MSQFRDTDFLLGSQEHEDSVTPFQDHFYPHCPALSALS